MNTGTLYQRLRRCGDNMNKWKQETITRDCGKMERIPINEHMRPL